MDLLDEGELLDKMFLEAKFEDETLLVEVVNVVESFEIMVISRHGCNQRRNEAVQHSLEPSCREGILLQLLECLVPWHVDWVGLLDSTLC